MIRSQFVIKVILQGGGAGLSLLSSLLLARILNVDDFAIYNLAITYIILFSNICTLGLGNYGVKYISQNDSYIGGSYRLAILLLITTSCIVLFIVLNIIDLKNATTLSATALLFSYCFQLKSILLGENRIKTSLFVQSWILPISVFLFATINFFQELGLNWAYVCIAIVCLIISVIDFIKVNLVFNVSNITIILKQIKESASWMLINLLQISFRYIDVIVLNFLEVGLDKIAIYIVAVKLNLISTFLLDFYLTVYAYKKSKLIKDKELSSLRKLYKKNQIHLSIYSLAIFIIYLFFGKEIIAMYGSEYASSYTILLILCVGALFNNAMGPAGQVLNLSGHQNENLKITFTSAIIAICLLLSLTNHFGILGTAAAISISLIIRNVTMYIFARKKVFA